MTQFKSKSNRLETVSTALFDYPVLMAADILLYQTDLVPVGDDQKQHIEITRDIAQRFNSLYGNVLKIPEPLIRESGARIMGLDNPEMKMSKSIGEIKSRHSIGLLDSPDKIKDTIMKATTDSEKETRYEYASTGVKKLLVLYEVLTNNPREEVEKHFIDKNYSFLKREVVDIVINTLKPIQEKYKEILNDNSYLEKILIKGEEERASSIASQTLSSVKEQMGLK